MNHHLEQTHYALVKKPLFLSTPLGPLTYDQFLENIRSLNPLPYGLYLGYDDITCALVLPHLPSDEENSDIHYCLQQLRENGSYTNIKSMIQEKPCVKWRLIQNVLFLGIETFPTSAQEILRKCAKDGAEYQFLMRIQVRGRLALPVYEYASRCLNLFGTDAFEVPDPLLSPLHSLTTLSHQPTMWTQLLLLLQQHGIDMNQRIDSKFENTYLHYQLALEMQTVPLKLIEITNYHYDDSQQKNSQLDFTIGDRFGKTPLHLTVGLNLSLVFQKLVDLHKLTNRDIGLNQADNKGRTPAMIAAALGRADFLQKLIGLGADLSLTDNQGHDIHWYAHASRTEVEGLLKQEYSIDPMRSATTSASSYLYGDAANGGIPWMLLDKRTGAKSMILMSGSAEGLQRLELAKSLAPNASESAFIETQMRHAKVDTTEGKESTLSACLRLQEAVRTLLTRQLQRISLFKTFHENLLKELNQTECRNESALFILVANKKYIEAICNICTVETPQAPKFLTILLKYQRLIKFNLDEQRGEQLESALHLAAKHSTICYDLLIKAGANSLLPNSEGITPMMIFKSLHQEIDSHDHITLNTMK